MVRRVSRNVALTMVVLGAGALPAAAAGDATLRAPIVGAESCSPPPGAADSKRPEDGAPPVLVDGLGYAGIEADSRDLRVRAWFAQGVRLIYAFDEVEAVRSFRKAQELDPDCALCFFGEAWARGPTINLQPRTEELAAARAAARRAVALAGRLGPRDKALVDAMALRTRDGPAFANAPYAEFLEEAARRLPDDDTIAVMAADARLVLSGGRMREGTLSQQLLERVLARNPDHGGAIHYYIHLTDWIDRQDLAEPYADRLGGIAPAASHLVHMPSHTFFGIGRYRDAAQVNVSAIAADGRYEHRVRPPASDYRTGLLAHDMHFAIESALAHGDGATALDVSDRYRETFLARGGSGRFRMLGSATWYARGLHGDPAQVLAIAAPSNAVEKVFRHYARGEALARNGDSAAVRAEAAAIAALRAGADSPTLGQGGTALATVMQHVLEGRAAMLARDFRSAEAAYRRAMDAQLAARFGMDPPLFWYSVRRSLAAARLARGDARGARAQLTASLEHWPNDPLALYALSLAERRLGRASEADAALDRARAGWAGDVTAIPLTRI
jgi:tetratricopeptide (TPR) repeat protein